MGHSSTSPLCPPHHKALEQNRGKDEEDESRPCYPGQMANRSPRPWEIDSPAVVSAGLNSDSPPLLSSQSSVIFAKCAPLTHTLTP
ncbi:hypothetical protein MHYP_G00141940 [Metynnis hypsauchen]